MARNTPPRPRRTIHFLTGYPVQRSRDEVTTACGLEGAPSRSWGKPGIVATPWPKDVNCPRCRPTERWGWLPGKEDDA